jgi:hypothetical protein
METSFPLAFLKDRRVDIDAEIVFHIDGDGNADYMRIDSWLVNGSVFLRKSFRREKASRNLPRQSSL